VADRPNVLVVMQDQLRYDLVRGPRCATPNLDGLRAGGTSFVNAYTPTGLCGPARASFLTGLYPHTHGVLNNVSGEDAACRNLPSTYPTLAELFAKAGYRTGYVGKWHVGVEQQAGDHGFADVRLRDQVTWAWSPDPAQRTGEEYESWVACFGRDNPNAVHTRFRPPHPRVADRYPRHTTPLYSRQPITEAELPCRGVVDHTIDLMRAYASEDAPFLLMASFLEPHWPNVLPEPYASMYDPAEIEPWPNFDDDFTGKPGANRSMIEHCGVEDFTWDDWRHVVAHYLGACSLIDAMVGDLLAALDEVGLADSTVVLATADHGDMAGSHRQFNKGPLMYEEVYRIPFVWRGPGIASGAEPVSFASHVDVVPTLLDLAGLAPVAPVHGESLAPVLGDPAVVQRTALAAEFHGLEYGLYSQRMVREGDYKLVYNVHDVRELYDLARDPHELVNLAYEPAYLEIRRDLEATLLELLFATGDPLRGSASNVLG
jgi:arylsulfatase A-like enzyme